MIDVITKYFPEITARQREQFAALYDLYVDWNAKINVISRKDITNLYEHHVLHSLAIAKFIRFKDSTNVLDFGTGGGFPGIPLAIMFPNANFKMIDGTGKKIKVATEVANAIGLENVLPQHKRGEEEKGKFDFIVSRAVMPLPDLMKIVRKNIAKDNHNALENGVIVLKGGNLNEELQPFSKVAIVENLSQWFTETWFEEKNLIYVPMVGTTIPHRNLGIFGAGKVILMPAAQGTGVIAGSSARTVLEAAGLKDVKAKSVGSKNIGNIAYATLEGLRGLMTVEQVAKLRGKKPEEILG